MVKPTLTLERPLYTIVEPGLHLSWEELRCRDGTWYPLEWEDRARILADCFEAIRGKCGFRPIRVLSAYRTPTYNKKVGGATRSQHVEGRALDLAPPEGVPLRAFWILVKDIARSLPIRGLGIYEAAGFVHIDTRPGTIVHIWRGGRPTPETPGAKPHAIKG